jgi:hypothetical protein
MRISTELVLRFSLDASLQDRHHSFTVFRRLMMKTQANDDFQRLESGQARHLERLGGELTVLSGRIWLTRDGAKGDHFLEAGDTVNIDVDEYAVIESAFQGGAATLRWTPRRQPVAGRILSEPLLGLAFVTRIAALAFGALARHVAAAARWSQGRVDRPVAGTCESGR